MNKDSYLSPRQAAAGCGALSHHRGADREASFTTSALTAASFTLHGSQPSLHDNTPPSVSPSAPSCSARCEAALRSVAQRPQPQETPQTDDHSQLSPPDIFTFKAALSDFYLLNNY